LTDHTAVEIDTARRIRRDYSVQHREVAGAGIALESAGIALW
jgi:hypothetical protein